MTITAEEIARLRGIYGAYLPPLRTVQADVRRLLDHIEAQNQRIKELAEGNVERDAAQVRAHPPAGSSEG